MTEILKKFMKATSKDVCGRHTCDECSGIYNYRECPMDIDYSSEEIDSFVQNICERLRQWEDQETFDWQCSDEEFVELLEGE